MSEQQPARRTVIRGLTVGAGSAGLGVMAGLGWARTNDDQTAAATDVGYERPAAVPVHGPHQAGIERPHTPQRHNLVAVYDLPQLDPERIRTALQRLGDAVTAVTTTPTELLPDGPGDVSVTVAIGPRLVRALAGPDAPGAEDLPLFAGDEDIPEQTTGGDLLLAAYSSDPNDADGALAYITDAVADVQLRWSQRGFRAPGQGTVARNPLGFHDGVIVPRGEELTEHVWIPDGPAAGGTVMVVRRIVLDSAAFRAEPVSRQEEIIGRRRTDGAPLSGGGPDSEVDLLAKTPDGRFHTPARSHVRAAHPSFTGSHLMLRRGYGFDNGGDDAGLMFLCYQRDLRTYVRTQQRLDESDDLMDYVRVTASGTFLVLPGFGPDRPLGSPL